MQTVNTQEAKTHLSRLVDQAVHGEPFAIAKAGRRLVKVIARVGAQGNAIKRRGFMRGQISVPDDFDTMSGGEVSQLFTGTAA